MPAISSASSAARRSRGPSGAGIDEQAGARRRARARGARTAARRSRTRRRPGARRARGGRRRAPSARPACRRRRSGRRLSTTISSASRSASSRYCVVSTQRGAVGDQALDRAPHLGPARRVEAGRRLVEEDDRAVHDQAGREVEPAAHAAGVGPDLAVGGVLDPEAGEQLVGARERVAPWRASAGARAGAGSRARSGARRARPAGRRARSARARRAGSRTTSWPATNARPAVGASERGEDADGGRLAGAVVAEQAEHGARLDGEVQAAQGLGLAEALAQILRFVQCTSSYGVR